MLKFHHCFKIDTLIFPWYCPNFKIPWIFPAGKKNHHFPCFPCSAGLLYYAYKLQRCPLYQFCKVSHLKGNFAPYSCQRTVHCWGSWCLHHTLHTLYKWNFLGEFHVNLHDAYTLPTKRKWNLTQQAMIIT